MSKEDARNEDLKLSPAMQVRFDELVTLLAQQGFGEKGLPCETIFAQDEVSGVSPARPADEFFVGGVACQRDQHSREGHGEVLE